MNEYTQHYYESLINAPPIFIGAIQYEYNNPASHIPGAKEFMKSPIKIIPDAMYGEVFLQITHSELIPNIMPGRYYVSNFGRVFDMYRMKYLPGTDNGNGYLNVKLTYIIDNITLGYKTIYIHQLVNYFFNYPRITNDLTCNHIDLNKLNNNAENLEWIDEEEQKYHRMYMEQQLYLQNKMVNQEELRSASHAKISAQTADKICQLLSQGFSCVTVAKIIGIGETTVREIRAGRTWPFISRNYDFSNCADGRVGDNIDMNLVHEICRLLADNKDVDYISSVTGLDRTVVSAVKCNGLYPEIRKIYGIHHYSDD